MSDNCIQCSSVVRARQEALQCDGCGLWQHRTCGTGIDRATYRAAVQTESVQAKLFDSWDKYDNRERTAAQLLKACSHLNGPARAE